MLKTTKQQLTELQKKHSKECETALQDLLNFKKDMGETNPIISDEELLSLTKEYIKSTP